MKKLPSRVSLIPLILGCYLPAMAETQAVNYVDPFIGTGRQGKTFPGAATPAGMIQLSPDTITGGDNGSGYRNFLGPESLAPGNIVLLYGGGWAGLNRTSQALKPGV